MIAHNWKYISTSLGISHSICLDCGLEKTVEYNDYTQRYKSTYFRDDIKQKKAGDCTSISKIRDSKLNELGI